MSSVAERGLALQPGQRRAEAVVDAVAVAEVLIVTPRQVERVRPVEALRIAVGGGEHDEHRVPGGDVLPADAAAASVANRQVASSTGPS